MTQANFCTVGPGGAPPRGLSCPEFENDNSSRAESWISRSFDSVSFTDLNAVVSGQKGNCAFTTVYQIIALRQRIVFLLQQEIL
jgi:hypothetical protein